MDLPKYQQSHHYEFKCYSPLVTQIAYVLAIVEWETAQNFKPVREALWLPEESETTKSKLLSFLWPRIRSINMHTNYRKYCQMLELDLVNNPDMAMESGTALFVLAHGFKTGAFTGRSIGEFINIHHCEYQRST
jgi:hypothetical protein